MKTFKAGDQIGYSDYWMGGRKVLFTAEVVAVLPVEPPLVLLSSTGFWGPLPDQAWSMNEWYTMPAAEVEILEGEDLDYLNSFNETTEE